MLKNFILDRNRKKHYTIFKEISDLWENEGRFLIHYFTRLAYRKGTSSYDCFISFFAINKLQNSRELHTQYTIKTLENKIGFSEFCYKNNILTPRLLGYIKNKIFIGKGKEMNKKLYRGDDLILVIRQLIKTNRIKSVFLKPIDGIQGKGCCKVGLDDLSNSQKIKKLFKNILSVQCTYIV